MALVEKKQLVIEALDQLAEQFKNKPRIEGMVRTAIAQWQELEASAFDLLENRSLATAVGTQLDGLGQIVGVERAGLDDVEYRTRIGGQIVLNRSSGTTEDILGVLLGSLFGSTIEVTDYYPAAFIAEATTVILNSQGEIAAALVQLAKAAGVQGVFVWVESATQFTFSDATGWVTEIIDTTQGYGDAAEIPTQTSGGNLAGAL